MDLYYFIPRKLIEFIAINCNLIHRIQKECTWWLNTNFISTITFCCVGELKGLPLLSHIRYAFCSIRSFGTGGIDLLVSCLGNRIWKLPWFSFNLEDQKTTLYRDQKPNCEQSPKEKEINRATIYHICHLLEQIR